MPALCIPPIGNQLPLLRCSELEAWTGLLQNVQVDVLFGLGTEQFLSQMPKQSQVSEHSSVRDLTLNSALHEDPWASLQYPLHDSGTQKKMGSSLSSGDRLVSVPLT